AWWKQLSIAARETVGERYSIENCARQWVDFLQSLDRGRAAPTPFKRPRVLQLPPRNPKFGDYDLRLSWKGRLKDRLRSVPIVYRGVKAMRACWHRALSQWLGAHRVSNAQKGYSLRSR